MAENFLLHNIWLVLFIWGLVYASDYYFTIYSAKLFQGRLKEHLRFEGSYELTPAFQKDIDTLRFFSPNFLLRWLLSLPLLFLVWWLSYVFLEMPQFFDFLMGGLFLREAAVHLRHIRNHALASFTRQGEGLQGRIKYARWLILKLSAVEIASFGIFFLIISLALERWFFFGGGLVCLVTGYQHWRYAIKQFSLPTPAQQET